MQRLAPGVVVRGSILQGRNPERDRVHIQECGLSVPRSIAHLETGIGGGDPADVRQGRQASLVNDARQRFAASLPISSFQSVEDRLRPG